MKNSFFTSYEFKFFLIAVSTGILISIFPLTYNVIQLQKSKNELNKNIQTCLKEQRVEITRFPKSMYIVCDSKSFSLASSLINYPQFKLKRVELEIAKSEVRYLAIKGKILHLPTIIVSILSFLGILPLLWVFFLNRICDISNAIRGNKK